MVDIKRIHEIERMERTEEFLENARKGQAKAQAILDKVLTVYPTSFESDVEEVAFTNFVFMGLIGLELRLTNEHHILEIEVGPKEQTLTRRGPIIH